MIWIWNFVVCIIDGRQLGRKALMRLFNRILIHFWLDDTILRLSIIGMCCACKFSHHFYCSPMSNVHFYVYLLLWLFALFRWTCIRRRCQCPSTHIKYVNENKHCSHSECISKQIWLGWMYRLLHCEFWRDRIYQLFAFPHSWPCSTHSGFPFLSIYRARSLSLSSALFLSLF